jgi:hypothetical protein
MEVLARPLAFQVGSSLSGGTAKPACHVAPDDVHGWEPEGLADLAGRRSVRTSHQGAIGCRSRRRWRCPEATSRSAALPPRMLPTNRHIVLAKLVVLDEGNVGVELLESDEIDQPAEGLAAEMTPMLIRHPSGGCLTACGLRSFPSCRHWTRACEPGASAGPAPLRHLAAVRHGEVEATPTKNPQLSISKKRRGP